jgi:hypothetical protein
MYLAARLHFEDYEHRGDLGLLEADDSRLPWALDREENACKKE